MNVCEHCRFEESMLVAAYGLVADCPKCGRLRPVEVIERGWQDPAGLHAPDETTTELEIRFLLYSLVRVLRPLIVVETGCFMGASTLALARACQENGIGRVVSCDIFADHVGRTAQACNGLPVTLMVCRGIELRELRVADLVFCDSDYRAREEEIAACRTGATIVVHDTRISYDSEVVPLAGLVARHGGISFPTHRGFGIIRKREGV